MSIHERIAKTVTEWPNWSRAERKRMPELIEEIIDHCKTGNGNDFIRHWCDRNLTALFTRKGDKPAPSVPDLLDLICELTNLVSQTCGILEAECPDVAEVGYWNHDQKTIYEDAKTVLRNSNRICPED